MSDFIDLRDDKIVTAIKKYSKDGKEVSLVGVMHIGEREYYEELTNHIQGADSVLWEKIDASNPQTYEGQKLTQSMEGLHKYYGNMARAYGVDLEYEIIDFENPPENWEHCDMDIDTLGRELAKYPKELNIIKMCELLGDLGIVTPKEIFKVAVTRKDQKDDEGSVIISKRNDIVKKRIDELLQEDKEKIAILYGAGHMDDLENYLTEKGFELEEEKWLKAMEIF